MNLKKIKSIKDVKKLSKLLVQNKNLKVRVAAAWALGAIEDTASVPVLATALEDTDYHVRETAARALGAIKVPAAVPVLVTALGDENVGVREAAAYALEGINWLVDLAYRAIGGDGSWRKGRAGHWHGSKAA